MSELSAGEAERAMPLFQSPDDAKGVSAQIVSGTVPIYEKRLDSDRRWALSEGSLHFEKNNEVFKSLRSIAKRLKELDIPYAVVGGMALFQYGFRRFTEDVDLLVTKKDLKKIHKQLDGLGYVPPFQKSKHLRDTSNGVKIEFLITGDFPGDGKKKPVSFPNPRDVSLVDDGISYISLEKLIELKIASGMTNEGRLKDLADVIELIKVLDLPADFANQLDAYVRKEFKKLWRKARKRYVMTWRNKWLTAKAKTIEDMVSKLRSASDELERMLKDGVTLDDNDGAGDDNARLVTTDSKIAEKYGLVEESEYWSEEDEEDIEDVGASESNDSANPGRGG